MFQIQRYIAMPQGSVCSKIKDIAMSNGSVCSKFKDVLQCQMVPYVPNSKIYCNVTGVRMFQNQRYIAVSQGSVCSKIKE